MLRKQKTKQKTVAEKVAEIISHPNQSGSDSESDNEATPRVVDFDEDEYQMPEARTTEFRKRNVKLLSEQSSKYKGKISSRKDFEEAEEEEESEDSGDEYEHSDDDEDEDKDDIDADEASESDEDDEALKVFSKAIRKEQTQYNENDESDDMADDQDSEDDEEEQDEDEDGEDEDEDDTDNENEENQETEVISKINREAEIQKGLCVQNQLHLWERLLELRINSQKIITKMNQLPASTVTKVLETQNDKYKTVTQEATRQTQQLLQSLLTLQDTLYSQNSELSKGVKLTLKRSSPFKQHNSEEPPLKQVNTYLQERFENFRSYRNSVLLKWDDRTKLLQPGAGAKKRSMNEEYDIIKKIDNALMNKSVLIQKSQQMKNNQPQKNNEDTENQEDGDGLNPNVYDDSDFYHQQLRELIEYKANTSNNMSEVTKQFLELQKLRQKMKKKVDTRASKGRKLRYVVHNKLMNFLAPHDNSTWTDESKDELCKSLFV